jgi:hypothetical protein
MKWYYLNGVNVKKLSHGVAVQANAVKIFS